MLNKELLLASNRQNSKNYTHIVTVGKHPNYDTYGYSHLNSYGSIDNGTLNYAGIPERITDINQTRNLKARVIVDGFTPKDTVIFLGRSDTKVNFGRPSTIYTYGIFRWDVDLFTVDDVGKEIPIWLSTAPPHTNSKKTSMEESVDAQQGITVDGRWGKTHRESYPKLQFKRRRRIYSSKRCVHRESGVFRQQSNTSNRNCHNSCKYRRSATFRNTSNIHSECLRYDWFRFQCWNIHSIRKQCIDKYQATNLLIVWMEALYA